MKGDIVDKDEYAVDGRTRLIARTLLLWEVCPCHEDSIDDPTTRRGIENSDRGRDST